MGNRLGGGIRIRNKTCCHLGEGTVVGTVKGGNSGHILRQDTELADELEVGRDKKEKKKKPRTMSGFLELQAEMAAISWDDTAGGASLSPGRRCGGQETKGLAWAGQVSAGCQTSVEDFI